MEVLEAGPATRGKSTICYLYGLIGARIWIWRRIHGKCYATEERYLDLLDSAQLCASFHTAMNGTIPGRQGFIFCSGSIAVLELRRILSIFGRTPYTIFDSCINSIILDWCSILETIRQLFFDNRIIASVTTSIIRFNC